MTSYYQDSIKDRFLVKLSREFSPDEIDKPIVKLRELL